MSAQPLSRCCGVPREHKGRVATARQPRAWGTSLAAAPPSDLGAVGTLRGLGAARNPPGQSPQELSLGRGMQLSAGGHHGRERLGHWRGRTLGGKGGARTAGPDRAAQGGILLCADCAPVGASQDPSAWKGNVAPGSTGPTGSVHQEQESIKGQGALIYEGCLELLSRPGKDR